MKIVIFGAGKYFSNRKGELFQLMGETDEIVAFIDNREKRIRCIFDIEIHRPSYLERIEFDAILLMCAKPQSMRDQLLSMNIPGSKLYTWEKYKKIKLHGEWKLYIGNPFQKGKKKILIITTVLNYNGASLAAMYAAMALRSRGYDTCLCAPQADIKLTDELTGQGLNLICCPSLPYVTAEEIYFIRKFDIIIVNVYQMIATACDIAKHRPLFWWIHEPSASFDPIYENVRSNFSEYDGIVSRHNLSVYAVASIAKHNFEDVYPNCVNGLLSYGIPDEVNGKVIPMGPQDKPFVFAIIGGVTPRKAQRIFLEAAAGVEGHGREVAFWVIGSYGNDPYGQEVQEQVRSVPQARLLGRMTREEIREAFRDIDCVVCASLEDPLPIVVTEGMMHGKVCITTDATGQAEIIQDGVNGFLCKAGDRDALREKMQWVLDHWEELGPLCRRARETYERHFSMEAFADRLEKALLEAERMYRERDPEKAEG